MRALPLALWIVFAVAACERRDAPIADRKVVEDTDRAAAEVKGARTVVDQASRDLAHRIQDVSDETNEMAKATRDLRQANQELEQSRAAFTTMRDEVIAQGRSTLILIRARTALLRGHAHLVAHPLSPEVEQKLGDLELAVRAASEVLDRLAAATADTWPVLKKQVDDRFHDIDDAYDAVSDLVL